MINNKVYGLLGLARRAGKISFGTESSTETIQKGKAKLVIVASDSSQRTKKNFEELSRKFDVEIRIFGTIENLSKSIGQNNKAVIVLKDKNFSDEIVKKIDGGEVIG